MIKAFLFTVIAVAGLCTAASGAIIDYRDYDRHHDRKFDDHDFFSRDDGRDHHHDHHDFSWDDKWFDHDDKDHHHDHDFRWWLVASSSGFDTHDHWWFDDHGRYCRPGDPGDPVSAVPLPPAVSMFGGALLLLGALGWRRRILQNAS